MTPEELVAAQRQAFDRVARIVGALAAPARLQILQFLSNGPRNVQSLADVTKMSVANTSQHLQKMARDGLVSVERRGVTRLYRLRTPTLVAVYEELQGLASELDQEVGTIEQSLADSTVAPKYSLDEICRQVADGQVVVLDVRPTTETTATPIPGAQAIPEPLLQRRLSKLPRHKAIYVACRGRYCITATHAVRYLRGRGFDAYRLPYSPFRLTRILNGRI